MSQKDAEQYFLREEVAVLRDDNVALRREYRRELVQFRVLVAQLLNVLHGPVGK